MSIGSDFCLNQTERGGLQKHGFNFTVKCWKNQGCFGAGPFQFLQQVHCTTYLFSRSNTLLFSFERRTQKEAFGVTKNYHRSAGGDLLTPKGETMIGGEQRSFLHSFLATFFSSLSRQKASRSVAFHELFSPFICLRI